MPKNAHTVANLTDIPAPAGAVRLANWQRIFSLDELHRWFYGTSRDIGYGVSIVIGGHQNSDGSIRERFAYVSVDNSKSDGLDAAALRVLACAAIGAADELDALGNESMRSRSPRTIDQRVARLFRAIA